jgi:N-carbamoyl-L-amino-acid hydrolase
MERAATATGAGELSIDGARLWRSLELLGEVGAYRDERTGLVGVNRLALTAADGDGRRLVKRWFEEAGLAVRVDRIGNVWARRKGRRDDAPVVMGSHIDTVPTAGRFDGCLGVLGALECLRTLDQRGIATGRPIEVAFFTDEEGCRFGTDMLGSAVACGRLPLERAYGLADRAGLTVRGELSKIGFLGDAPERLAAPPHAYLECHVEQGPILAAEKWDLGVVSGVQAISWQEVVIVGKSAHAGTTPMELRRDAGLTAARLDLWLDEAARSGRYGEMRATMGAIDPSPGLVNIVPGRVRTTVDLRNPDDAQMARSEQDLAKKIAELAATDRVEIEARQTAKTPRIHFSTEVQALLARHMDALGLRHRSIVSGAGHDAQEFAAVCPTAMVFVPGEYEGISHNPREYSTPEACTRGVNVLLHALLDLAE